MGIADCIYIAAFQNNNNNNKKSINFSDYPNTASIFIQQCTLDRKYRGWWRKKINIFLIYPMREREREREKNFLEFYWTMKMVNVQVPRVAGAFFSIFQFFLSKRIMSYIQIHVEVSILHFQVFEFEFGFTFSLHCFHILFWPWIVRWQFAFVFHLLVIMNLKMRPVHEPTYNYAIANENVQQ